jgi:hypothetical protein
MNPQDFEEEWVKTMSHCPDCFEKNQLEPCHDHLERLTKERDAIEKAIGAIQYLRKFLGAE